MKKIFFLVLFSVSLTAAVNAQTQMTNPNGLTLDTASQAAAEGPSIQVKGYQSTVSLHVPVTKISGTIAGSIKWQGSNDSGTTWFTIQSDTLTDATNVYGYSESPKKWGYYRALITQTGTSSLSYKGWEYQTRD